MATTVNNYLKNVMKSVAYAAADVSDSYIPSMKEFSSTNKEFATATYAALKNPSQFVKKQVQAIQESKIYKALDYGARNLSEDLRTGNFYNKERKERDELALSGLDANWDDLSEYGIDDDWEKNIGSSSSPKVNDEITAGDLKVVESIEGSNAALASATVNAVITSSNNQIKNGRANTAMLYAQNEKLFGGLHKDITILGSTMQQMYKLQSASLQNIDKNMSSFFTQESKLSAERNAILKEMLELQRNVYKSAADKDKETAGKKKSNRIRWSDINSNGIVNLSAYFGAVKKNINSELASIMPAGFGEDSNMLAEFMVSPLEGAMKYVVNGVIPATVKAASKQLDASVSGIFGNIIGALGNARSKNEGGLLGTIAKFLGVSTSVNRSIDTSRYEKGPVPFDGITRKAIIDVIPTHLRRIEAAITGRPEEMFDYKSGRWVKVSSVSKQFDDIKKNAVKRATSELREAMNPGIQAVRKGIIDKNDRDSWDRAVEEFEQFIFDNNGRFNPKVSASKNGIDSFNYPNLYKHYSKIRTIFSDFDKIASTDRNGKTITRNTRNSIRMRLSNAVLDAKDMEDRQYRDIESDVTNVIHSIFGLDKGSIDKHGKYTGGKFEPYNMLKNTTDKLGNTIFDYLQNINAELTYMRSNGIFGGGGGILGNNAKTKSIEDIKKELNRNPSTNNYTREYSEKEKIAKAVLDTIKSGRAVDLRDFSVDEQAYLLQLSTMLSSNAIGEYKSEIQGYNENEISKFIDKHFIKTNIKSQKDIEKAIKEAEKSGKNTNEVMDAKEETFFKKIMNRIGAGESVLGGIVGASSEAFTNLLYTADKAIYEMMYKTEIKDEDKKKYNGFIDAMVGKMTDKFKAIGDQFKKDIIDPFKERLGIDKDFNARFKDGLMNTGSKLWTSFKDANASVYGPAWHQLQIDLGLKDGETRAQQARAKNRRNIRTKLSKVKNATNIMDDNLISVLRDYGLNFADYGTVEEALSALIPLMEDEMYTNSNGLKEYDNVSDNDLEMILNVLRRDKNKLKSAIDSFGYKSKGTTDEELIDEFKKQFLLRKGRKKDDYKNMRKDLAVRVGNASDSARFYWLNQEGFQFEGTIEEKQNMLLNLAKMYGVNIKDISSFDTDDKLNKAYIGLMHKNNARGTIGLPFSGLTTLTKGEGLINSNGFGTVPKTGIYNITDPTHIINTEDMYSLTGSGPRVSVQQALGKEKLFAKKHGFNIAHHDQGTMKITKDGVNINSEEFLSEAKKYIPEAAGGGLIGGILSMVLGLAGGPLLGAAIGAGGSILANSEVLKTKLFGKAGADGKRDGSGLISKTIMDKFHKYFPDMAKYGLAGIIPGLLTPLGPIGGLMAGAAFGFLKNNERFTNKYFGENGKLTIKSKEKKILQDMLPGALKGAGIGAIAKLFLPSPFGIVGNAAIGAALGMMASTEEFKNGILGREINGERVGGIANEFKEALAPLKDSLKDFGSKLIDVFDKNVVNPIAKFITPAIYAIPQLASIIPRKINDYFRNKAFGTNIEGFFRNLVIKPIQGLVTKILTPVAKTVTSVVTSPFRLIGWAGDKIRERQIRTDNASYMTARERIDFMINKGKGNKISERDKVLADIGTKDGPSVDDAKAAASQLRNLYDYKDKVYADKRNKEREINRLLDSYQVDGKKLSEKAKKKLRAAMETGNMDQVRNILSTYSLAGGSSGLTEGQINSLLGDDYGLGKMITDYTGIKDREKRVGNRSKRSTAEIDSIIKEMSPEQKKVFKDLGIDLDDGKTGIQNRHFVEKYLANLETEIANREANGETKEEALNSENNKLFKDMVSNLEAINKMMAAVISGDDQYIKDLKIKHKEDFDKATADLKAEFDFRNKDNEAYLGKEFYDKLDAKTKDNLSANTKGKFSKNKATKANKNRKLIKQYKMTPEEVNACGGDVEKLSIVLQLGYRIAVEDIPYYNRLNSTDHELVINFLKLHTVKQILAKRTLTESDFKYAIGADLKAVDNHIKYLISKNYDLKKIKSIQEAMTIIGDNGQTVGESFGAKIKRGVRSAASFIFNGAKGFDNDSDLNEIDDPDDKKELIPVGNGGELIHVKRKSDGSVEPDTSDSKTKSILNKLNLKEKAENALHSAQMKMSKLIGANFDTSDIKESKGGKLGWISLLLTGGYLWKSGLLKKLFDGFIKPIWTDHLKPWITDTAVPWISDKWNNNVKPWLIDTAIPALGDLFSTAIAGLIEMLPALITAGIKGVFKVGDTLTGNKYNAGASTRVNAKDLSNQYGSNYETGMYDEKGNALTAGDIESGNYNKIYNAQGIEGKVNSDGSVTFKDDSKVGASYLSTVGSAAAHSFARSLRSGKPSKLVNVVSNISKALTKPGATIKSMPGISKLVNTKLGGKVFDVLAKSPVGKIGGFISKTTGYTGKLLTSPVKAGQNLGIKANSWINNLIGRASDNITDNVIKTTTFKEIGEEVLEETAENSLAVVTNAGKNASKKSGFLASLITKLKNAIKNLFSNSTVKNKLAKAAGEAGQEATEKWVTAFKNKIDDIFTEALEKGVKKAGVQTTKNIATKALFWVFLITDFLTGCDQAESILGVSKTGPVEEFVAGLINALCNFLIIPSIFPGTNWIARKIFGIFSKTLEERQDKATKEYEEYVKETGSTLSKEEYLKRQNSLTGKVGGWISDKWKENGGWKQQLIPGYSLYRTGKNIVGAIKSIGKSGKGKYGKGAYSKQIDPTIAGMRFNTSYDKEYQTIGDSGCGPAAAVNAIEAMYGRGSKVAHAARFALNHGYKETNGGTKPGFFTDYFNSNGLGSQTSYNKSVIARNIANGLPTVIMGSDARGTSSSTPFGKTPHYVTVTGTDGRGNAIVQDPESRYDNQLYPLSSLMKNTSLGVSAFGRGKWGRGDNASQIWWYLKQMGMTDAGAAGLMGNLFAESGLSPNNLQNSYEKSLGLSDAQYTANVDSGLYSNFANDSAGYGLAQWTSAGRKAALYNLVKSRGVSISDLATQLDWLSMELNDSYYKKVLKTLTSTNSLSEASDMVLTKFERPKNQGADVKALRQSYGQKYLEMFNGKAGDEITGSTLPSDTSNNATNGFTNILSSISSTLGSVLSNSNAGQALSLLTSAFSNTFSSSNNIDTPSNTNTSGDFSYSNASGDAASLVDIVRKEVGTKESGNNYVKYNDWFYGRKVGGDSYPWCAAFVSWAANQAGIPTGVIPKTASTKDSYSALINNGGKISNSEARPGDIIFFTNNGSHSGIYHTGVVVGHQNGIISTVEGNSSNMVAERSYNTNNSKVLVARPKYLNAGTATNYSNSVGVADALDYSNTRGGNGIKPLSKYGQFKNSIYGRGGQASVLSHRTRDGYVKVEESAEDKRFGNAIKSASRKNVYGMAGTLDYTGLINTIINILMTIADNTDKLNLIVTILNNKLGADITASDVSNATTGSQSLKSKLANAFNGINSMTSKFNTYADTVGDHSTNLIISLMNGLASE